MVGDEIDDTLAFLDTIPSTLPQNLPLTLVGFQNYDLQTKIFAEVKNYALLFGKLFDLSRLVGITISFRYAESLAQIDRGFATKRIETPTATNTVEGVAKTTLVLRDNIVKSHTTFSAEHMSLLAAEDDETKSIALYTLAHELAHVHDHKMFDVAFPNILLKETIKASKEGFLLHIAMVCWEEYIASRLSAHFGPKSLYFYENIICSNISSTHDTAHKLLQKFSQDNNFEVLTVGMVECCGTMLKYLSYLIGHLHGSNGDLRQQAQRAFNALQHANLCAIYHGMESAFENMFSEYPRWTTFSIFEPLENVAWDYLRFCGVTLLGHDANDFKIMVARG